MEAVRKPLGLEARGGALWDDITTAWELRADEFRILEHASRTLDDLDRLQKALVSADLIVQGSQRQPRRSPLIAEVRAHRELLSRLLRQLDLPDVQEPAQRSAESLRKSAAAHARVGSGPSAARGGAGVVATAWRKPQQDTEERLYGPAQPTVWLSTVEMEPLPLVERHRLAAVRRRQAMQDYACATDACRRRGTALPRASRPQDQRPGHRHAVDRRARIALGP